MPSKKIDPEEVILTKSDYDTYARVELGTLEQAQLSDSEIHMVLGARLTMLNPQVEIIG